MYGISSGDDTTFYFVRLSNGDSQFTLHNINLRLISMMNSIVYVSGGNVYFEKVKMDGYGLPSYYWVNPLIDVDATLSSANIHFLSTNITNCNYKYFNTSTSLYKSSIIFFTNTSTNVLTLTMLSSFFHNNTFYLSSSSSARGGICQFQGPTNSSIF
jgi:hypothetical protein